MKHAGCFWNIKKQPAFLDWAHTYVAATLQKSSLHFGKPRCRLLFAF